MNRSQRMQNRLTAGELARKVADSVICERCGNQGRHYFTDPMPSMGGDCSGWTCEQQELESKGRT